MALDSCWTPLPLLLQMLAALVADYSVLNCLGVYWVFCEQQPQTLRELLCIDSIHATEWISFVLGFMLNSAYGFI